MNDFFEFPKISRFSRECVVTEKIDGTNAQIYISGNGEMLVGSRTRWITPSSDNFGFAKWAHEHYDELIRLGPGRHFGEWWGSGIQRGYGLTKGEKRFSLFNTARWNHENVPQCCHVVPVLYKGMFDISFSKIIDELSHHGSFASPGFLKPEGIVIYHTAASMYFKKTILKDESPKTV